MVAIISGKSRRWHSDHCCICGKHHSRTSKRISGTATFPDDEPGTEPLKVIYCPGCAETAKVQQDAERAAEQLRKGNANNEGIKEAE